MNIFINSKLIFIENILTILQVCSLHGFQIPRFCYHERLNIAANCRMCLVEVGKQLKPIAACAVKVTPFVNIFTKSALVINARKGVLEFLLINHPLDCPVCDQGGECDLQDQTLLFAFDRGRFYEHKRSVFNQNCSFLIKLIMTRCIHCTRCVRFLMDIAGESTLALTGRGNSMQITTYLNRSLLTDVFGNIIDLCPVGALTSKIYSFTSRLWENRIDKAFDFLTGYGTPIRLDLRNNIVLRVLPILTNFIKNYWITDKIRFGFDSFFINLNLNNFIVIYNSDYIKIQKFNIFNFLKKKKLSNFFFSLIMNLEVYKVFFTTFLLKLNNKSFFNNFLNYKLFNFNFFREIDLDIYKKKKKFLFFSSNPRSENPLFSLDIRQFFRSGIKIFSFGLNFIFQPLFRYIGSSNSIFNFFFFQKGKLNFLRSLIYLVIFFGFTIFLLDERIKFFNLFKELIFSNLLMINLIIFSNQNSFDLIFFEFFNKKNHFFNFHSIFFNKFEQFYLDCIYNFCFDSFKQIIWNSKFLSKRLINFLFSSNLRFNEINFDAIFASKFIFTKLYYSFIDLFKNKQNFLKNFEFQKLTQQCSDEQYLYSIFFKKNIKDNILNVVLI